MKTTKYTAKELDEHGRVLFSDDENAVWHKLITRQMQHLRGRACDEYFKGLETLDLPKDRIPQLTEVSNVLQETTGWRVYQVPALISFDKFFQLLSERQFPVATFIRTWEDLDYLQEPDIFHEIFGHCPLLTNKAFADFTELYGKLGVTASKEDRVYLARLYWFTVEFGLVQTLKGLRIYGGGVLSSPGETLYALASDQAERSPFDLLRVLRTPYRIDIMQPVYYVLEGIEQLYEIAEMDILGSLKEAKDLGLLPPKFSEKEAG
jgi:phenylalanine-4-hydroxylase